jgi:hypothetical protein
MAWRFPIYMLREFVPLFFIFVAVLLVMVTIDYVAVVAGFVITYKAPFTLFVQSWLERFPYLLSYITPPSLAITILIGLGSARQGFGVEGRVLSGHSTVAPGLADHGFRAFGRGWRFLQHELHSARDRWPLSRHVLQNPRKTRSTKNPEH